jgi:hypothetical protein
VIERTVERTVSGGTTTIVELVPCPVPDLSTKDKIRTEIKKLKKQVSRLEKKLKKSN